jgi:hypothetical protein
LELLRELFNGRYREPLRHHGRGRAVRSNDPRTDEHGSGDGGGGDAVGSDAKAYKRSKAEVKEWRDEGVEGGADGHIESDDGDYALTWQKRRRWWKRREKRRERWWWR